MQVLERAKKLGELFPKDIPANSEVVLQILRMIMVEEKAVHTNIGEVEAAFLGGRMDVKRREGSKVYG
jgi:hypothetical protein